MGRPTCTSYASNTIFQLFIRCLHSNVHYSVPERFPRVHSHNRFSTKDSTGDSTGSLALYGETIVLVMVFIWGAVSDRIQKRSVHCVSILFMGLAIILYPHVKNVYPGLLLLKLVSSAGSAGSAGCITMMTAMMTDVVHRKCRRTGFHTC